jgi:hypothetical protein
MRRRLLFAILVLLIADASGITSFIAPETCALTLTDQIPDGSCPAFCARCSCCAAPVVRAEPGVVVAIVRSTYSPLAVSVILPAGTSPDILHVPKPLLA